MRYLVLLVLHFAVNFALLPDNVVASHPVHHDDYTNLAATLDGYRVLSARPVSTFAIVLIAGLGSTGAYIVLNLLVVACVLLCIRFVELFVRRGERLPAAGFAAAGMLALSFAHVVDWTKYFGLLTNLSSALPALAALCAIAAADLDARRARALCMAALALAAVSFLAKEDFALPLMLASACIALVRRSGRWAAMTAAVGGVFVVTLAYSRVVGSVFVLGSRAPADPYFIDLSPLSLASSLDRMLLGPAHGRLVVALAVAATAVAIVVNRRDRMLVLRFAVLIALAFALLAPYSIFPNHAFAYYAFMPIAVLSATLAAAAYAAGPRRP
jgi:hypothetical protein